MDFFSRIPVLSKCLHFISINDMTTTGLILRFFDGNCFVVLTFKPDGLKSPGIARYISFFTSETLFDILAGILVRSSNIAVNFDPRLSYNV